MVKCSFSEKEIPPGTGLIYVTKAGRILYFLNSKCEKNFLKLKRKARNLKWISKEKK